MNRNRFKDPVSKRPFSEESLETFGAISSVNLLRRDNIAYTQEMLRKKEERIDFLAEILKSSPVSVIATDGDAKIIYCNPAVEKLYGYQEDELIGNNPGMLNAESNAAEIQSEILDTVRRGRVWRGEILNRKKNGDLFYVRASIYKLLDKKGNFMAFVGFHEDITERRRVEDALKESEEKYRTIFENTGTATLIIEEDTSISLVNTEFEKLTGYSKGEAEGKKSWAEFVMKDDLERLKEYHDARRIDPNGVPRNHELKVIDRRGNIRDVFLTADLIPGTKKSVASALDITEHKRMVEALGESERRYRLLAENVTDVIWTMDLMPRFTYISPSIKLLLGYGVEEVMARTVEQILAPRSLKVAMKVLGEELAAEKKGGVDPTRSRVLELELNRKDGSTVWAEVKVTFLRDVDGTPSGILGVARDITKRRQAEEAIKRRNLELSVLNTIACAVSQSLELDAILDETLGKLLGLLPIDMAAIYVVNEDKWRFPSGSKCAISEPFKKLIQGVPIQEPVLKPVLEEGNPIILSELPPKINGWARVERDGNIAFIPLTSKKIVRGILAVCKQVGSTFCSDEVELLTTIGNQVGLALHNAWLYQELKTQRDCTLPLIETMPDGMAVLDEKGRLQFGNRRLFQLLGYSAEESLGNHWTNFFHPDDHDLVRAETKHGRDAQSSTYECRQLRKDGTAFPVLISWTPRFDDEGQYKGALGIVTDLTERKRAEEELKEYESRYAHLLDHMPDGVALTRNRRIMRANSSMAVMLGYPSPEKMEGLFLWDLAAAGSKMNMRRQSALRALEYGGKNRFEFQALRIDGSLFPAEITLTVDRGEHRPFVLAIIRDLSEREEHESLRRRLSERILKAQERDRASIARELHDELGQALTAIKMDMAWIKSHLRSPDEAVSDRLEALENLTDATLESVREMAVSLRPSVLDRLGLGATLEWYAREFERRTGIECVIESEPPDFNADSNVAINAYRIFQEALTNIARHAGASRVDVRMAQDGRYFTISISDNGKGIPSQKLSGPMSLGIAGMCERAELVKGRLDIRRRRPKGTKVTMYFPLSPNRSET